MAVALFAAFGGREALEEALTADASTPEPAPAATKSVAGDAYITSLAVEGFRGIGSRQSLGFSPGPGLTLVIGRNGSGKSSFAEALEVLFTGDSKRWSERPKVWKEGWRNLHHPHPASITAELLLAGTGLAKVETKWEEDADLDNAETVVQPKGKPKTTFENLGWGDALVAVRPFLSYNELGSLLDEGPSRLYDALSLVLGLEDLVEAQATLAKARTERQKAFKDADQERKQLIASLEQLLEHGDDDRASVAIMALKSKDWGLATIEGLLTGAVERDDTTLGALQQASSLAVLDAAQARQLADELREAETALTDIAGSDADRSRELAKLLQTALEFHESHKGTDCPVCGTAGKLGLEWVAVTRTHVAELRTRAAESERVHHQVDAARNAALSALRAPAPRALALLAKTGVEGADAVTKAWTAWNNGARLTDLAQLADFIEKHQPSLAAAVTLVKEDAAKELQKRQDRWRPLAAELAAWHAAAGAALSGRDEVEIIKEAEDWLKTASAEIRDERFAPIAENAIENWRLLRQNSNVELGRIGLTGSGTKRSVALDVTVDGVSGAALGVMSQGELTSLALSLFLPRATLAESPFRFVVIDDPVQSMDPSRVDGLANVLDRVAKTRQVVVFTHDDRLPEAVRRLGIRATQLAVTRRPGSVVEVRVAMDPVEAAIDDALALVHTAQLPRDVLQRVVPGYCRSALEAAFVQLVRRRRLARGQTHADVERELEEAKTLNTLASLALFDDANRAGEVMQRLNKIGGWAGDAFVGARDGAHGGYAGDMTTLVQNTKTVCERILELK